MSSVYRDHSGVRARIHRPTMNASRIATLRPGSREARKSKTLNSSETPPNSLTKKSSKVDTSESGGRKNRLTMSGLLPKISRRPPAAPSKAKSNSRIRKARYGELDIELLLSAAYRYHDS